MKPALVIIGLGNPGKQYENTRHNVGYQALDVLAEEFGVGDWEEKQKFLGVTMEARVVTFPALLVKPSTYMNLSGNAIAKLVDFYKLDPTSQIIVVCDDIDLPLADVRFKNTGGPGTHNGLKSINEKYGEAYPRLRIGIGSQPAGADLSAWVLSRQTAVERDELYNAYRQVPDLIREFVIGDKTVTV